MHCGNNFCVYWDNKKCILNEVSLDISGQCEDCILIDIEEDLLKQKRQEILDRLD